MSSMRPLLRRRLRCQTVKFPTLSLIGFILLVWATSLVNCTVRKDHQLAKGLLLIPGLGRADRLMNVLSNLRYLLPRDGTNTGLRSTFFQWECVVYVYAPREEATFWSHTSEIAELSRACSVIEVPGQYVTQNIFMAQPALIKHWADVVFMLLDDIRMESASAFSPLHMLQVMVANNLSVASPMIVGANKGGGQKFRNIMQTAPVRGTEGFVTNFVEIFAWIMTVPAYEALWELQRPHVNPYAWGYDFWYHGYAGGKSSRSGQQIPLHRMGIVSTMQLKHVQGEQRTDGTAVKVKWNAVLAQERHFKRYLGVDLGFVRQHLDIANTSWNGAVTGYLHSGNHIGMQSIIQYFRRANFEQQS